MRDSRNTPIVKGLPLRFVLRDVEEIREEVSMAGLDLAGFASEGGVLRSIVESSFVFKSANVDESVEPPPVKKRKVKSQTSRRQKDPRKPSPPFRAGDFVVRLRGLEEDGNGEDRPSKTDYGSVSPVYSSNGKG